MVSALGEKNIVAIEVDGPANESLRFRPFQGKVRGRFDWDRVRNPQRAGDSEKWKSVIPGQCIVVDTKSGECYIFEPLHLPEHSQLKRKIEMRDLTIQQERTILEGVNVATACFWMRRAVEAGLARLVAGDFPKTVDSDARKHFIFHRPESDRDRLADALIKQAEAISRLAEVLAKRG